MNKIHQEHKNHHRVTFTAMLLGFFLITAYVILRFFIVEPFFHPLESYALLVPGIAVILRSFHPPIGFLRVLSTLLGGILTGASAMFFDPNATTFPAMSLALIIIGAALLGGSFTERAETIHHHKHA